MKLTVTGKHLEITDAIRDRLNQKLGKVIKSLDEDHVDTHVVLTTEKHRQLTEITVKTKGNSFHIKDETEDLYTSIDHAVDKMEKQLRKHKERAVSLKTKQNIAQSEKNRD